MRNVVLLALVCGVIAACSSDTPPATDAQYCAAISANLAQLNAPSIVDAAGVEATSTLYRSITSIAPLAVQKEWETMTSNVEALARTARYSGSARPACRMNHTGTRSWGVPRHASRNDTREG